MGRELQYSTFQLGEATLHQLHTSNGRMFAMSEIAVDLFHENPGAFGKDLRAGRYSKVHTQSREVLRALSCLGIATESHTVPGATLLTAETVESLLTDRRKGELVQPFKLALLKLASQEAAKLMAAGDYEMALPVAMDAVAQGQALFRPAPALQLFPLYLLAAQANLGLRRAKQCEDFLGLAAWLALKEPDQTSAVMKSQLSRLFGQLYALQGKFTDAARAFAEDMYHCSLEYGATDVRTSLGFYNLSKVFQSQNEVEKSLACSDLVVKIWLAALQPLVLHHPPANALALATAPTNTASPSTHPLAKLADTATDTGTAKGTPGALPLGPAQLREVADMLQDICSQRADALGALHVGVAEACMATGLTLAYLGHHEGAQENLERAGALYADCDMEKFKIVESVMNRLPCG